MKFDRENTILWELTPNQFAQLQSANMPVTGNLLELDQWLHNDDNIDGYGYRLGTYQDNGHTIYWYEETTTQTSFIVVVDSASGNVVRYCVARPDHLPTPPGWNIEFVCL